MSIILRTLQTAGYVLAFALGALIATPALAQTTNTSVTCDTAAHADASPASQAVEPWYIRGGP